jgi:hypothetical protein
MSPGCNTLVLTTYGLCKHMRIHPFSVTQVAPVRSAPLRIMAKLKRSKANIVPYNLKRKR